MGGDEGGCVAIPGMCTSTVNFVNEPYSRTTETPQRYG